MSEKKQPADNSWKTLSSKIAYKNPWMQVREDKITRPDGSEGLYGFVETHGPSVFIVPLTDDKNIYLINQYRYPVKKYSWELPAGGSDGQDTLIAAKRELQEETGLIAKEWQKIGSLQVLNGLTSEIGYTFLAQGLTQTNINEQFEEGIVDMKAFTIDELQQMIKEGQLTDAPTIAIISQTLLHLESKT